MKLDHKSIDVSVIEELVHSTDKIIFDEEAVSSIKVKGAADYVTRVDVGVQDYLQKKLAGLYPEIGFIGEEQAKFEADPKGSYWILDPIDGTTNLIHHYRMSAVSLGLYEQGEITFGIVYNPFNQETFLAAKGQGAYLNGEKVQVSDIEDFSLAVVSYGSSPYEKERAHGLFQIFEKIFMACSDFRRSGSAAMDLCYVACGRHEAFVEQELKPWDYAAGALIVKEAGGQISVWDGDEEPPYLKNSHICATNGKVNVVVKNLLRQD